MSFFSQFNGGLKSVQRGTDSGNKTITITSVDTSKCIVTVQGGAGANSLTSSNTRVPYVSAMTSTSITISGAAYSTTSSFDTDVSYSWEVAEFY